MAFQTGTASSPTDLLSLLVTFATANGWVVYTPTSGYVFHNPTTGQYVGVAANTNTFLLAGALGYNSGAAWNAQPGATTNTARANDCAGPYKAYYFFSGPGYIHVVVERSTNLFKHFMFGELEKAGSYVGGHYFDATHHDMTEYSPTNRTHNLLNHNVHRYLFDARESGAPVYGSIRIDYDGKTNNWLSRGSQGANSVGESNIYKSIVRFEFSRYWPFFFNSPNLFNQRTVLIPIDVFVSRPSNLFSPVGTVKDVRFLNIKNFTPGEILTLGSDEWYVFPHIAKTATWDNSSSLVVTSGNYGYAYRKIP